MWCIPSSVSPVLPHLRIGLPAEGGGELHVAPLGLAEIVRCGIDLGCHVQHVNSIFCYHWEKRGTKIVLRSILLQGLQAPTCWVSLCLHHARAQVTTTFLLSLQEVEGKWRYGGVGVKSKQPPLLPQEQLPEGTYCCPITPLQINTRCLHQTDACMNYWFPPSVLKMLASR